MSSQNAITPLRIIFWVVISSFFGGMIVGVGQEFGINAFLVVNLLGMIIVTYSVFMLTKIEVNDFYRKAMNFSLICGSFHCFVLMAGFSPVQSNIVWSSFTALMSIVNVVAIVLFARAMMDFSIKFGLRVSVANWKLSSWLIGIFMGIPAVVLNGGLIFLLISGTDIEAWMKSIFMGGFPMISGAEVIILLAILTMSLVTLVPYIHFLVTTHKTISNLKEMHSVSEFLYDDPEDENPFNQ